uniref:PAZ domain-containing protein n=1 Tax=Plectus sambesii TaxID=2011161 RepID=A0A914VGK5_9BILA
MSGIGQGRGGSQRPGRGRKTAENPSPHERHGASSPGVDSMLSQEASSTRSRSDSGTDSDAVSASTQRIATLAIDDVPPAIVADKLPPGKRQVRAYKVQTNVFGVIPPKNHPVYRYDFRVVAMFGAKSKELTKQSREDYVSVDRKDKCTKVFKHVVEKNKDFFNGLITLIYDRAAILYTATKFPVAQGAEKTIMMAPADFPSELGLDDKCTGVMVKVKPVDEFFELILDDFQSSIDNNLDKQDRSLKQFFEIATSQAAFFNGDHVTYGSGVSYLLDQNKFGFSDRDCPELCEGKYLAVGSDKSIRFVEGPNGPGNVNAVVVVDTKKAAFHKYQGVVNTITEILRLPPNRLSQLTLNPAQTRLLRTQLKDLFVETNYGGYRKFQICGISEQAARDIKFNDKEGRLISLVEYFKTAYGLVLQYPNLPCLLERKPGKGAADYSKYPMELCTIGDNQRVTQAKQTPAQMEKMIKACATLPAERLKQNERNIKALQLNNCGANNQWLANMQLRITSTSLTCPARQLPAPTAEYAGQQKVKIDNDKGTWRASDKRFYQPASVGTWVVVVLQQPGDRYNITKEDTIAFLEVYKKQCKAKGMAIGDEATIRPMDAVESAVESFFKEAQSKGVRFIFFIQNDNAHVHHKIKLCEVQYQIVTQDLMMSTAKAAPRKFQTLENIVQKTNIKLGGLNFNLLLENPAATQWITKTNRLIIGLDVSHPPPLSAQEMARGMKPKAPSVIGVSFKLSLFWCN